MGTIYDHFFFHSPIRKYFKLLIGLDHSQPTNNNISVILIFVLRKKNLFLEGLGGGECRHLNIQTQTCLLPLDLNYPRLAVEIYSVRFRLALNRLISATPYNGLLEIDNGITIISAPLNRIRITLI